jgi:uncharacterized membrane protein HdeD (DUF308 family)
VVRNHWKEALMGGTLRTDAVVLGVWLLVYGVMEIVLAFQLRSVGRAATRIATAT